ncbi:MAG TPA: methylenetetrahydrofolate reductase C-terminal domain-containing protein [Terriglobales bacterium]|nr:methylenetetrahydrofolate reductase C-terminal domain-containing protein [Terriglobales bacterium]
MSEPHVTLPCDSGHRTSLRPQRIIKLAMPALVQPANHFRAALESGEFVHTAELVLGRDHTAVEAEAFVREASGQPGGIQVISLADLPGGNPALPPDAFVAYVLAHKLTPIAHLSGKDGNRSFLEARLHALARLGAENILALTGDAQKDAFAGKAKPVYDLDSALILWLIRSLRPGLDYALGPRTVRTTPFDFFPGAVVNPFKVREPDLRMQFYKLQLKVAAGARYIITQLGYNLRKLYELRQYMLREGLGHVPVLANVYVPTAKIAQLMQAGEVSGCVIPDSFLHRLEQEKKPQRLERAALMVAAARDLGFAGAHIGGFGLTHRDVLTILERASAIGKEWRGRMEELVFPYPGEFYLLPPGGDGLSDGSAEYQLTRVKARPSLAQRFSEMVYRHFIKEGALGARWFGPRLRVGDQANGDKRWRHGLWYSLLAPATAYRKATLGCVSCGDCLQDHLNYAGCSMSRCYKELRNGPCGGSRPDGSCEARPDLPCVWNQIYLGTLAVGDDPAKFARILIPPRDWSLDRSNALANRFAGLDNLSKRIDLAAVGEGHGFSRAGPER